MADKHPIPAGNGKAGKISTKKVVPGEAKRGAGDNYGGDGKSWRTLMRVPGKDKK